MQKPLDAWLQSAGPGRRKRCGVCNGDQDLVRDIAEFVAGMGVHHVGLARFWREYLVPRGFKFSREKLRDHVDGCLRSTDG